MKSSKQLKKKARIDRRSSSPQNNCSLVQVQHELTIAMEQAKIAVFMCSGKKRLLDDTQIANANLKLAKRILKIATKKAKRAIKKTN